VARSFFVDEVLARYVAEHSTPPDPVQQDLIAETAAATGDHHRMQIGADQGTFLSILTAALRPRLAVESGPSPATRRWPWPGLCRPAAA